MSRCSLQALQNVNQRKRPAVRISRRRVSSRWTWSGMTTAAQTYPRYTCGAGALARLVIAQTVFENQIARLRRQVHSCCGTERHEQSRVRLLQMWKPSAVPVLRECLAGRH